MVIIGNVRLNHGLMLAPMAGVTDRSYRQICVECGAELVVTEMVSAKAIHYGDEKTAVLAGLTEYDRPASVQIFGSEPEIMAEAAAKLMDMPRKPDIIDLNMGCPVQKIVNNGEGSRLMQNPSLAYEIIRAVRNAVSVPVTVKFRTGWSAESINAPDFAKTCEQAGASAVCIHGRTRTQMYAPPVDLDTIAKVKKAVSIPVFGNGGIETAEDAVRMLEYTGVDGLGIARGSMGNPWLFSEIAARLEGREFVPPAMEQRLDTALRHVRMMVEDKGEFTGIREGRRHLAYYVRFMRGAGAARGKLNEACTLSDMEDIVGELKKRNREE